MFMADLKGKPILWGKTPDCSDPGWYFVVDVWGNRPHLAVVDNRDAGPRLHRLFDYEEHGITNELLEKAVEDAGGNLKGSNRYAVSPDIGIKLWTILGD